MANAYWIRNSEPLKKGDAISARQWSRGGLWNRAFFQRVLDTSVHEGAFQGDLVVIFEGSHEESYIRPNAAHGIMVRGD